MKKYTCTFGEIDKQELALTGGKGANLGELSRIDGIRVPEGFCITTEAYREITGGNAEFASLLDGLSPLKAGDREKIAEVSAKIRRAIEETAIPNGITQEIDAGLKLLGEKDAYAVRSSATAEDLPGASFAGQQDTYLNVIGTQSILEHVSKCLASLFTERAVTYRIQNGFGHGKVRLSVVVQKMVFPEASGIMFTADPLTGNRKVVSIDAGFGLGEALVSGIVTADNYKVRGGVITDKTVSAKERGVYAIAAGGTEERAIEDTRQNAQTLTDGQILELEQIGRKIESRFGCPQDIEWCLCEGKFYIVQSRPITTLFPVPENKDGKNRVYMSFGHQQMFTDAMKPLGLSVFRYGSGGSGGFMVEAGGRLFMDLTPDMASAFGRNVIVKAMGKVDPLVDGGLKELLSRKDFLKSLPKGKGMMSSNKGYFSWALVSAFLKISRKGDENTVPALIRKNEQGIRDLEEKFSSLSGDAVFAAADEELNGLIKIIGDPEGLSCVWVGNIAAAQIKKSAKKLLDDESAADILTLAVPNSIAGELGLGLLSVADTARKYPAVIEFLENVKPGGAEAFWDGLGKAEGGVEVSGAIRDFLKKFGVRCDGDIDITRPRWIEEPSALSSMILSNIENFRPGASKEIYERDLKKAEDKEREILSRLPAGKAKKMKKTIDRLRNFIGYREYPKFIMVSRYWIIKQAIMREAEKLVGCGVFREIGDMDYLSLDELREAARTQRVDYDVIQKRKEDFSVFEKLSPPRLMTSDGEIVQGRYDASKAPEGAIQGVAVSPGTVEGRARVVLRLEDAKLAKGDILVAKFTDPSWTPVFVSIGGLVAEVGGIGTHGSVVAREYGIPAVVGVDNATGLIKDGQQIRVNGTDGYVEILS